jgi:hypothetical protein
MAFKLNDTVSITSPCTSITPGSPGMLTHFSFSWFMCGYQTSRGLVDKLQSWRYTKAPPERIFTLLGFHKY